MSERTQNNDTQPTYSQLLAAAENFCSAFASATPPETIFSHFSTSPEILAIEHGLPELAPFLGRPFRGISGIKEYFGLLSEYLSYERMHFSNYVVDTWQRKVSVRGEARFTWTSTGQGWGEVFTYVLEFDDELKVKVYEVWADSGAAYLASRRELRGVGACVRACVRE